MNDRPRTNVAQTKRIDAICGQFESAWHSGSRPAIGEFLGRADQNDRQALLGELYRLDVEYRRRAGEAPTLQDYLADFPELAVSEQDPSPAAGPPTANTPTGSFGPDEQWNADDRAAARDSNATEPIPACLGRYQVTGRWGAGSFGVVYRGRDPDLDREVAIKIPRRERVAGQADIQRFLEEARTVARLDHPGIVPVYDCGQTEDGRCFVVSKFIPGRSLRDALRERRFSPTEAASLVADLADAAHHAHLAGIIHRDIKPANILLEACSDRMQAVSPHGHNESGHSYETYPYQKPLLADFGLALRPEEFGQGAVSCGTAVYMSPEQAAGRANRVDGRSDIYSLGVVLYELLTAQRPYRSQHTKSLLAEIADETVEVRPLRQVDSSLPAELERICLKALAKRPADRYTAAADLAADLRKFAQESVLVPGSSRPLSSRPLLSGPKWGWIVAGAAAVVGAVTVWLVAGLRHDSPPNPTAGDGRQAAISDAASGVPSVEPLRVVSLDIQHFANLNEQFDQPRGVLGEQSFSARLGDSVTVRATLSRPAYAYLIAFRPDGTDELCFPEDEGQAPPLTDAPRYPSVSRDVNYGLNEGSGLWVFAVVARDEPLPPYRQWRSQQPSPPWPPVQSPLNVVPPNVVLWDDGQWLESLTPAGKVRGARGKGVARRGKSAVVRITDWLQEAGASNAAAAIGFAVAPQE